VDTSAWKTHEDYEVFPIGAREKSLLIAPKIPPPFCLPNHRYLFKQAIKSSNGRGEDKFPDQYWAEVIAYKIGRLMGVEVPPAFVAYNSSTKQPGSLIEWFIGYEDASSEGFIAGGDIMHALIKNYDRKRGQKHNLETIIKFSELGSTKGHVKQNWKEYWGLCLCFDAVIGNTDRHQENWGIIVDENRAFKFTPYFDNGTSLGHELQSKKLKKMMADTKMFRAYVSRGQHHMRQAENSEKRLNLIDGTIAYAAQYPDTIPAILSSLDWDDLEFESIILELTSFQISSPLTEERANFIIALTKCRQKLLRDQLEACTK
jgi:hypothetical protein